MDTPEGQLPDPPLPATVDLRMFRRMPLDVLRLRDSDIARAENAEGFRCAVLAWCVSWHQVPASSLPDDNRALADLLGIGRTPRAVKEWLLLRETALRGFVKCSDGKLYHLVVAEMAIDSWGAHLKQKWKSMCSTLKKQAQRRKQVFHRPEFDLWITKECPEAVPYLSRWTRQHVPEDTGDVSPGHDPGVPRENAPKGREGKLSTNQSFPGDGHSPADSASGSTPGPKGPKSTPRADGEWRRDPTAADRKARSLGLTPGRGESHESVIRRIEVELHRRDREQRSAAA